MFTREEAAAIVAYLEFKRDHEPDALSRPHIDAALDAFWRKRAADAPTNEQLREQLAAQRDYVEALRRQHDN